MKRLYPDEAAVTEFVLNVSFEAVGSWQIASIKLCRHCFLKTLRKSTPELRLNDRRNKGLNGRVGIVSL